MGAATGHWAGPIETHHGLGNPCEPSRARRSMTVPSSWAPLPKPEDSHAALARVAAGARIGQNA